MYGKVVIFLSFITLLNAQECPDPIPGGSSPVDCELVPECNFDNGTLTPLATQCSNELADGDCEQLFPCPTPSNGGSPSDCDPTANTGTAGDSTTYPYVRAPACLNPNLRNIALQCKYFEIITNLTIH